MGRKLSHTNTSQECVTKFIEYITLLKVYNILYRLVY